MSGGPDFRQTVRIGAGSVAANLVGGPGTVPSNRIPTLSTISGSLNVSTKTFGTLSAQRTTIGTTPLSNFPGTLPITTKTSGSLPINTRATGTVASGRVPSLGAGYIGTLPNVRLPRNINVGTFSGVSHAGSLNRGTVPSGRAPSLGAGYIGSLPAARLPYGPTVSGTWAFSGGGLAVSPSGAAQIGRVFTAGGFVRATGTWNFGTAGLQFAAGAWRLFLNSANKLSLNPGNPPVVLLNDSSASTQIVIHTGTPYINPNVNNRGWLGTINQKWAYIKATASSIGDLTFVKSTYNPKGSIVKEEPVASYKEGVDATGTYLELNVLGRAVQRHYKDRSRQNKGLGTAEVWVDL